MNTLPAQASARKRPDPPTCLPTKGVVLAWCTLTLGLGLLGGCQTASLDETSAGEGDEPGTRELQAQAATGDEQETPEEFVLPGTLDWSDLEMLLSMTFEEASAISAESIEVGSGFRVAADEIEVVSVDRSGAPTRVVARGRVFVELRMDEVMVALAESAEVGGRELVLRGRPILGRGDSVLAGLSNATAFTVTGDTLRVAGEHEVMRRDQLVQRRDQLVAAVTSSAVSSGGGSSAGGGRSYQIDRDFELPPLPSATEQPDLSLLAPPPELPEMDEDLSVPEIP